MPEKISAISFGILSPNVVRELARVRIVTSELYDADGYPIEGGVMDPRLGVIDPGLKCRTCGGGIGDCPGHFGYVELAKPIIHVLYTKLIYDLLKITCQKCSRTMTETTMGDVGEQPNKCPHCKTTQKKLKFAKPHTFYKEKEELTAMDIRDIFEKIPDSDLKKAGFCGGMPEWLVLTLFLIPPVTMRPSITLGSGERSEDDLTHKLVDIVRINQSLKENMDIGAPEFIINDLWELVQYHVSTFFDNELTGAPLARHRSGRPLKGLVQRLKGKEGRIRGNLLGKRVNFSSRSVVSPDPNLSINEVGVPVSVAKELTIPEVVTAENIKSLKELVSNGLVNYIVRPDGRRIKISETNKKDILDGVAPDWTVERQLRDGDIVLFNRQPSLHKVSIMGHRVKILPYNTFRIAPSVCPPYNADFDGDEMNLHALQTEEARTEASMLMEVQNNIISPRFGGPIIGLDMDQISGIYLLTKKGTSLSKKDAAHVLSTAGIDVDLPDKEIFTGKEIFSLILPKDISINGYKATSCKKCTVCTKEKCEYDAWVAIENGSVKFGAIDASSVGAMKGKIIKVMDGVVDNDTIRKFIDNAGRLGVAYLSKRGFSIGISDLDLTKSAQKSVEEEIDSCIKNVNKLVEKYKKGELHTLPGMTTKQSLEAQIMNTLSNGVSAVSEIVSDTIKENDILNMAFSGAKGSLVNTTQMAALIGQETILGKRIKKGYTRRTLSHIKHGDLSPMAKGFVSRGFKNGLTPFELFWNIMNGREGLMDKSLRTRKSGYMQRRLVNALQDLKVLKDGTVRNAYGELVQFVCGEDGIDPSKSNWGVVDWKSKMKDAL